MQQLLFSSPPATQESNHHKSRWKLFIDGASRNNPGPAGAGVCLFKDNESVLQKGCFLGTKTNNQAEYLALLLGIFYLKKNVTPGDQIQIISDSQLLIRQLQGVYRVKNETIRALYLLAQTMLRGIPCEFHHVLRDENKDADKMANLGVDKKTALPAEFIQLLQSYEIPL